MSPACRLPQPRRRCVGTLRSTMPRSCSAYANATPSSSAKPTCMSWRSVARPPTWRRVSSAIPMTARVSPADRAAALRPPSRPASCPRASARTRRDLCAFLRPCAGSRDCGRRLSVIRGITHKAACRWRSRSMPWGRWHAPSRTSRSSTARSWERRTCGSHRCSGRASAFRGASIGRISSLMSRGWPRMHCRDCAAPAPSSWMWKSVITTGSRARRTRRTSCMASMRICATISNGGDSRSMKSSDRSRAPT